jgi:hypothetical protein
MEGDKNSPHKAQEKMNLPKKMFSLEKSGTADQNIDKGPQEAQDPP